MASNSAENIAASTRDIDNTPSTAEQDCSDTIHISLFFDGTGNNKEVDAATQAWSNPARMWMSGRLYADKTVNAYPIYVAGIGTPFNGEPFSALDAQVTALEDSDLGLALGNGGARRLDFGRQKINNTLRDQLLQRAYTLGGDVARYASASTDRSFSEVNRSLGKHRLIKQINVSIFGFSRGAALARAFCNQWLWDCEENRRKLSYEGYPIRFVFLGLFDTVASFGLPAANLANDPRFGGLQGRDLVVDERVERCVHYVAAHEIRFAFPADLIRKDGQLAGDWLEKVYPGVHSDVGGGYEPNDQGVNNNYARIPMRDMMNESMRKGTRLFKIEQIEDFQPDLFDEQFKINPDTQIAYDGYTSICNPNGTVEECVKQHRQQLYSAYGTMHRQGIESVTQRQHREGRSWQFGPNDMATELESYQAALQELASPAVLMNHAYLLQNGIYAMWISPEQWQLDAWRADADPATLNFIHQYIHDSKVGFMNNAEPFSYFSHRGLNESSRSVTGWMVHNVSRPMDQAVESTIDYASEKIDQAQEYAQEKAQQARELAEEAARQAKEAAQQAKDAAMETGRQIRDIAVETGNQIGDAASSAGQAIREAATEVGNTVSETTRNAVDRLGKAWDYVWD